MIYYKTRIVADNGFSLTVKPERPLKHQIPSFKRREILALITDNPDSTLGDIEGNYLLPSEKEALTRVLKVPGLSLEFELFALNTPEKIRANRERYQLDVCHWMTSDYLWVRLPLVSKIGFSVCIDKELYCQSINYREVCQMLKVSN